MAAKRAAILAAEKNGSQKQELRAFKPASPAKRPTAPQAGQSYGTISSRFEHIPVRNTLPTSKPLAQLALLPLCCEQTLQSWQCCQDLIIFGLSLPVVQDPPAKLLKDQNKLLQAKPIYTNPCKQGSYGFNKTTLSECAGAQGVVSQPCVINPGDC